MVKIPRIQNQIRKDFNTKHVVLVELIYLFYHRRKKIYIIPIKWLLVCGAMKRWVFIYTIFFSIVAGMDEGSKG
jgi:hypothetical protein